MRITERAPGDVERLDAMIDAEARARQRDRLRMVRLALRGEEKEQIAGTLGVAKSTVESWAYRYRDGGLEALTPKQRPGRPARLTPQRAQEFKARFTAGPREPDGVCTLRGKDAVRILSDEYQVNYSLSGAYDLLHRLGLSCLVPRPRHEKNDPAAIEAFQQNAPLLSRR
jgi:transposase